MGQIALFELDHTDKSVLPLTDDKALSEILEVPDSQTPSQVLEIPDFNEGKNKADNGSDGSEMEFKVETKDAVRSECGYEHESEFVQSGSHLVALGKHGGRGWFGM